MRTMAVKMVDAMVADAAETAAELGSIAPPQFEVQDRDSAECLVRKVVEASNYIDRVKHQAEREIRRTQRERDFLLLRYGPQLQRWARIELENYKGRRKSVLLLSGSVGWRSISAKLVIEDMLVVVKWAKKHCRKAVVVVEKVRKSTINEQFKTTCEIPDGIRVEPATERFYVK
jgi:hypothetical protein